MTDCVKRPTIWSDKSSVRRHAEIGIVSQKVRTSADEACPLAVQASSYRRTSFSNPNPEIYWREQSYIIINYIAAVDRPFHVVRRAYA